MLSLQSRAGGECAHKVRSHADSLRTSCLSWFGISPVAKCYVLTQSARHKLTKTQEGAIICTIVQVNK